MTSDAVSVRGAHNSSPPSEPFADIERVIAEAYIRNLAALPSRSYPSTIPERT
jgi:hypothetical protein